MKRCAVVFLFTFAFSALAGIEIKPGLWTSTAEGMNADGKDMMAELHKQLEKLPEAQRKMLLKTMGSTGGKTISTDFCITKEMLDNPQKISEKENKNCKFQITNQSDKQVKSSFDCGNGNKGENTMDIVSKEEFRNVTVMTDKSGKKTTVKSSAKFKSSLCGK